MRGLVYYISIYKQEDVVTYFASVDTITIQPNSFSLLQIVDIIIYKTCFRKQILLATDIFDACRILSRSSSLPDPCKSVSVKGQFVSNKGYVRGLRLRQYSWKIIYAKDFIIS